mgnify:FL=1
MISSLKLVRWGLLAIVAIMPFHALLTIWAGDIFGYQMLFQAWKEIVIAIITAILLVAIVRKPDLRTRLKNPLIYLIGAYMLLSIVITLITSPPLLPALVGFKTNIAMLMVFVAAYLVSTMKFKHNAVKTFMVASSVVIGFGLLQAYLLPKDFLSNFGYGPETLAPFTLVDPAIEAIRISSTIGGANQLGAFLILPICLAMGFMFKNFRWWQPFFIASGLIVVWNTYSRSALIGALVGLLITAILSLKKNLRLPLLLAAVISAAVLIELVIYLAPKGDLEYYVFHQSIENTNGKGSTDLHQVALQQSIEKIQSHPWGEGLGTAGPSSFYSDKVFVPESWYLQLGVEVGVIGMLLFIAIQIMLALQLWKVNSKIIIAPALIGAMVGVGTVNFFLHGWADSSTALTFWTIAGASLGAGLYAKNSKVVAK